MHYDHLEYIKIYSASKVSQPTKMKKTLSAPNLPSLTTSYVPLHQTTKPQGMRKSVSTHAYMDMKMFVNDMISEFEVEAVMRVPSVVAAECKLSSTKFPIDLIQKSSNATSDEVASLASCLATPFEIDNQTERPLNRRMFLYQAENNAAATEKYMNLLNRIRKKRKEESASLSAANS